MLREPPLITDERKQAVDFTDPYAMAQLAILANANSGIATVDDLNQPGKVIAVKKGDTKLLDQLNEFIAQSKENGEFDRLAEKYLAEEKKAFDEYRFKWFFDFE